MQKKKKEKKAKKEDRKRFLKKYPQKKNEKCTRYAILKLTLAYKLSIQELLANRFDE